MTKEYANNMWQKYLELLKKTDDNRITDNPGVQFTFDAKDGLLDYMSDEEYDIALADVEEESCFFHDKRKASAYTLFLRAYQKLELTDEEVGAIVSVLAKASARTDFRHVLPPYQESSSSQAASKDAERRRYV